MPPPQRIKSLAHVKPASDVCIELVDNCSIKKSAIDFFGIKNVRDPAPVAAKLTDQFIVANRRLTGILDATIEGHYNGNDVSRSGNSVGAIPLVSPRSARQDFGLVVQPRFEWGGIGPMLNAMGWRVVPSPLKLPLLNRSERNVPAWVLSSMILLRIAALLDGLTRRFEMVHENLSAPRGAVNWSAYASRSLPTARFLSLPCTFPDLRDDRLLRGAIRYALERQIQSLESQRQHGGFVHRLIELAQGLLRHVLDVPVCIPTPLNFQIWMQRPMRTDKFLEGMQAIEWTVEERGLAGLSDLQGIPWRMPMEQFFEAWVETIFGLVARKTGALVKTGRQHQTTHAIDWRPSYLGSQKSLVPDIWLEWSDTTLVVDAKYKRHWEELNWHSWSQVEKELQENHRNDLFQVLAYANLAKTQNVVTCLAYPCSHKTWKSLGERNRIIHKATITVGSRALHLWLTAVPMALDTESVSKAFLKSIREVVAA